MYVLYGFLNRSSDCDEIWYSDRLDLRKRSKLNFVLKKVNKRFNMDRHVSTKQ